MFVQGDLVIFKTVATLYLFDDTKIEKEHTLSWLSVGTQTSVLQINGQEYALFIAHTHEFPNFVIIYYKFRMYYVYYDRIAVI